MVVPAPIATGRIRLTADMMIALYREAPFAISKLAWSIRTIAFFKSIPAKPKKPSIAMNPKDLSTASKPKVMPMIENGNTANAAQTSFKVVNKAAIMINITTMLIGNRVLSFAVAAPLASNSPPQSIE